MNSTLSSDGYCSGLSQWAWGSRSGTSTKLHPARMQERPLAGEFSVQHERAGNKGRAPEALVRIPESNQQVAVRPVSCRLPWSHLHGFGQFLAIALLRENLGQTRTGLLRGQRTSFVRCDKLLSLTGDAPELSVGNERGGAPAAAGPPGQSPPALAWVAPPALRDDEALC